MREFKILVVDDQYGRAGLDRQDFLERVGRDPGDFIFTTGQSEEGRNLPNVALELVDRYWNGPADVRLSLVLLDVRFADREDPFADKFGFTLLQLLRERFGPALPIVMLTAEDNVKASANESRADGFLPKECLTPDAFAQQFFRNALVPGPDGQVSGTAPSFLKTLRELRRVVRSGVMEMLFLGETGTGKSELAKYVHSISDRASTQLVIWFARATNPDLHFDQLFGHWKGAFDGAREHAAGVAEQAHRGTLFIDEIADLNPNVQTDLLEYRQRSTVDNMRRVRRLGHAPRDKSQLPTTYSVTEDRVIVDSLLITATNRPIDDPAWRERAGFRLDVFNRLGHRIVVPPLRERVEDIAPMFLRFLRSASGLEKALAPEARARLESHEWREGNVAELKRVAEGVSARIGPEFDEVHAHHFEGLLSDGTRPEVVAVAERVRQTETEAGQGGGTVSLVSTEGPERLVDFEIQSLWGMADRLRKAVIETRRPGRLGTLSDIFKHATGTDYASTDVKREVKDLLAPWFAPNERQAARWTSSERYRDFASRIKNDIVLSSLYEYAAGRIPWGQARHQIAVVVDQSRRGD